MKLNWRQNVLYLATLGIEGCWLYAILAMLNEKSAGAQLSTAGLLVLYPISFIFNRALQHLRWPEISLRGINFAVWAIAMLMTVKFQLYGGLSLSDRAWLMAIPSAFPRILHTFPPELIILAGSAILWWLGRRVSHLKVSFNVSVAEFQFGLVVLALILFGTSQLGLSLGHALPLTLTFFLLSLFSMAVSHSQEGVWLWGIQRTHWSGLLLVSIILIIILGFVISSIVTPDFIQLILTALKWLWRLIEKVIVFLASLLPEPEPGEQLPEMPGMEMGPPPGESESIFTIPEPIRNGLKLGWAILFGGIAAFALWRTLSYIFSRLRRGISRGEETESLRGAFKADLLNLLRRILLKLGVLRLLLRFKKKVASIPPEIASVREIYRHVLRWAAGGGHPRNPSQTPYEYLATLVDLAPEASGDLGFITQHYVNTRYGTYMPAEEDLHRLKQSWHNIKRHHPKKK